MELRHLRYFVAVAEELHFRRAAERLHIAQPAVSEQIRKLEEELGVRLFERTQRSVSLTAAGAALLDEARRVIEQAERAMRAARQARDDASGRVRFGCLPDAVPATVPWALRSFGASAPAIEVQLECNSARRLLADVRSGALDAAVVCLPAPVKGLTVTSLGEESAVAAVADLHPCAREPFISLEHLQRTPIIVLDRDTNPAFHDGVVAECWRTGAATALADTGDCTVGEALLGVASGRGIALLPSSVTDRHAMPGVRFKPLAPPAPACEVAAVWRPENASLALAGLLQHLAGHARRSRRLAAVA